MPALPDFHVRTFGLSRLVSLDKGLVVAITLCRGWCSNSALVRLLCRKYPDSVVAGAVSCGNVAEDSVFDDVFAGSRAPGKRLF
jgi:hypothetical protein